MENNFEFVTCVERLSDPILTYTKSETTVMPMYYSGHEWFLPMPSSPCENMPSTASSLNQEWETPCSATILPANSAVTLPATPAMSHMSVRGRLKEGYRDGCTKRFCCISTVGKPGGNPVYEGTAMVAGKTGCCCC